MKHELRLHPDPFSSIVNGAKTIECRLFDEKRQAISLGDTIVFTNRESDERVEVRVVGLLRYSTFQDLFTYTDLDKSGSQGLTVDDATRAMIKYYSLEEQQLYGVLGIELEVLK